jgi:hypothetical protein
MTTTEQTINAFIHEWQETPEKNREIFLHLMQYLHSKKGVTFDFIARPGITYSLRALHPALKDKELFVMIDVIEDNPRWLSICFFGAMITDPENKGDVVPGGLLGEDAICFDLEKWDEAFIRYLEARLDEAYRNVITAEGKRR